MSNYSAIFNSGLWEEVTRLKGWNKVKGKSNGDIVIRERLDWSGYKTAKELVPLLVSHDSSKIAGRVLNHGVSPVGVLSGSFEVDSSLSLSSSDAERGIRSGIIDSVSTGVKSGDVFREEFNEGNDKIITYSLRKLKLYELSLTPVPADSSARIDLVSRSSSEGISNSDFLSKHEGDHYGGDRIIRSICHRSDIKGIGIKDEIMEKGSIKSEVNDGKDLSVSGVVGSGGVPVSSVEAAGGVPVSGVEAAGGVPVSSEESNDAGLLKLREELSTLRAGVEKLELEKELSLLKEKQSSLLSEEVKSAGASEMFSPKPTEVVVNVSGQDYNDFRRSVSDNTDGADDLSGIMSHCTDLFLREESRPQMSNGRLSSRRDSEEKDERLRALNQLIGSEFENACIIEDAYFQYVVGSIVKDEVAGEILKHSGGSIFEKSKYQSKALQEIGIKVSDLKGYIN